MSCFHPNVMIDSGEVNPLTGNNFMRFAGSYEHLEKSVRDDPRAILIPCKKCAGCRLDYARHWTDRMLLELDHMKTAVFVTLTYDDDNVIYASNDEDVVGLTLCKKDMSKFMKDLRGRSRFDGRLLRFFGSGEYGSKTFRPHMHLIIFGLSLDDFPDIRRVGERKLKDDMYSWYTSDFLADVWKKGFVTISDTNYRTFAYVARYIQKKQYGEDKSLYYDLGDIEPEFSLMSRRPGIGGFFYQDHPECIDFSTISLYNGLNGVETFPVPKFILDRAILTDDKMRQFREERRQIAKDRIALTLADTELDYIEYMAMKEDSLISRTKSLVRNLDKEL